MFNYRLYFNFQQLLVPLAVISNYNNSTRIEIMDN